MSLDIPLFQKVYGFYQKLHSYHASIPKSQRYTLWQKCEEQALSLLEGIIAVCNHKKESRFEALLVVSHTLDLLKVFIRLAKDTRAIDHKQYLALQEGLQEIGKMVGGWLKSVPHGKDLP